MVVLTSLDAVIERRLLPSRGCRRSTHSAVQYVVPWHGEWCPETCDAFFDYEDKLHEIADALLMGVIGDAADAVQFTQFVSKNVQLYKMRNKYKLDTAATVHFTRKNLADSLRGGTPSMLNLLIAGYDDVEGCQLYSMDMLATCMKVPFATHGFGGFLSLGILDQYHKSSLTEAEAYEVLKLCVHEIHQRLVINLPNFQVKVVCRSGIHGLPTITPDSFK